MDVIINSELYHFPNRKSFAKWLREEFEWMSKENFFFIVREYA